MLKSRLSLLQLSHPASGIGQNFIINRPPLMKLSQHHLCKPSMMLGGFGQSWSGHSNVRGVVVQNLLSPPSRASRTQLRAIDHNFRIAPSTLMRLSQHHLQKYPTMLGESNQCWSGGCNVRDVVVPPRLASFLRALSRTRLAGSGHQPQLQQSAANILETLSTFSSQALYDVGRLLSMLAGPLQC